MSTSSLTTQLPYSSSGISYSEWVLNSGVLHYMSLDSSFFVFMSLSSSIHVMTACDTLMPLAGVVCFVITAHMSLSNVYFILNLVLNLASIG